MFWKLTDMPSLIILCAGMSTAELGLPKNAKHWTKKVWGSCRFKRKLIQSIKPAPYEKIGRFPHRRPVPGGVGPLHLLRGEALPGSLPGALLARRFHHGGARRREARLPPLGGVHHGLQSTRRRLWRGMPGLFLHEGVLAAHIRHADSNSRRAGGDSNGTASCRV